MSIHSHVLLLARTGVFILGFLAMEFVKYLFAEKGHLILNLFKSKDKPEEKV